MKHIQQSEKLLIFGVGPVTCCVPIGCVDSVVMPEKLTVMPYQDDGVLGVFHYRDKTVALVSLQAKFGLPVPEDTGQGRYVVAFTQHGLTAFWVDEVMQITSDYAPDWSPAPNIGGESPFDKTLYWQERICLYTDFDRLLAMPCAGTLARWIHGHLQQGGNAVQPPAQPEPISPVSTSPQPGPVVESAVEAESLLEDGLAAMTTAEGSLAANLAYQPTEQIEVSEAVGFTESAELTEPVAALTQPVEPTVPEEMVEPAGEVERAELAEPIEITEPVEGTEPEVLSKPMAVELTPLTEMTGDDENAPIGLDHQEISQFPLEEVVDNHSIEHAARAMDTGFSQYSSQLEILSLPPSEIDLALSQPAPDSAFVSESAMTDLLDDESTPVFDGQDFPTLPLDAAEEIEADEIVYPSHQAPSRMTVMDSNLSMLDSVPKQVSVTARQMLLDEAITDWSEISSSSTQSDMVSAESVSEIVKPKSNIVDLTSELLSRKETSVSRGTAPNNNPHPARLRIPASRDSAVTTIISELVDLESELEDNTDSSLLSGQAQPLPAPKPTPVVNLPPLSEPVSGFGDTYRSTDNLLDDSGSLDTMPVDYLNGVVERSRQRFVAERGQPVGSTPADKRRSGVVALAVIVLLLFVAGLVALLVESDPPAVEVASPAPNTSPVEPVRQAQPPQLQRLPFDVDLSLIDVGLLTRADIGWEGAGWQQEPLKLVNSFGTHIVIPNDTLWKLAKIYLNNPYRYSDLARWSNVDDPDLIYPGDKIIYTPSKGN